MAKTETPMLSIKSMLGINSRGHLTVEGQDTAELAQRFGTPLWVVSETTIRNNYKQIRDAFLNAYPNTQVAYASKANHSPAILRIVRQEGALVDVVTMTQLLSAKIAGVPFEKIIFNGNNKTEEELVYAVQNKVGMINVDSIDELRLLIELCQKLNTVARINVRIRPTYGDLSSSDNDFASDNARSKFGIDVSSGQALQAFRIALDSQYLEVMGVHHHVGWTAYGIPYNRELDLTRVRNEVREVVRFAKLLKSELDFTVKVLDLGGGFRKPRPHPFGPGGVTSIPSAEDYASAVSSVLLEERVPTVLGDPKLLLESGGYIVSDAVILLSRVGMTKKVEGGPGGGKLVAVDTSPYQFVRRLIFNFYHEPVIANKMDQPKTETVKIVGNTCAHDSLADRVDVPKLERGDIVALLDQGSYCEMISSQYCGIPRPATVLVNSTRASVVRKRETPDGILSQYQIPEWL